MNFIKKNRRGLSIVIGYILLISVSITMSIVVYQWLKTYVPADSIHCSEDTSMFIENLSYNCGGKEINLTLRNNGKFKVDGYFIYASNKDNEELAIISLSHNITEGGYTFGNSIVFDQIIKNSLATGEVRFSSFNVTGYGQLYKIEIVPIRLEEMNGKNVTASCSDATIREKLTCMK